MESNEELWLKGIFLDGTSQEIEENTKEFLEKKTIGLLLSKFWNVEEEGEVSFKRKEFWTFKFMIEITGIDLDNKMWS